MKAVSAIALLTVLLLTGCQTLPPVQTEASPQARWSEYHTFAVLPFPAHLPGADPGAGLRLGQALREETRATLLALGLTEMPAESADCTVLLRGEVVPKVEVTHWGFSPLGARPLWARRYPYGYWGPTASVDHHEEGTLIVEIYDRTSRELVWVGWITGRKPSGKLDVEEARPALRRILEELPLSPAPAHASLSSLPATP